MSPKTLSYADVEAEYGIPVGTLYALVCRRQIPHIRLGKRWVRFDRGEIEALLETHAVPAEPDISERPQNQRKK
jgi:excisionase family DNA binding protein